MASSANIEGKAALLKLFPQHHVLLNLPPGLTITICGGGNGAHTAAAYLGSKPGLAINVLTRQPQRWNSWLTLRSAGTSWEAKGEMKGLLNCVSDDPAKVIPQSDIVMVAAPAHTHPPILKKVAPHLKKGVLLGSLYCQGGFDWAARAALGEEKLKDVPVIWGLQNIPWICNAPEYGKVVRFIGPKKILRLAASPPSRADDMATLMASLFDIPCTTIPNFLSLTLTPSNQIIHPARYYGIFGDWDGKKSYKADQIQWGLYSELDAKSAEHLELLDKELQAIKFALLAHYPALDLSDVMPIKERILHQYGKDVTDPTNLETIFKTNLGYAGCKTPASPSPTTPGEFIPNTGSRLFWEDIPFGLCILKAMAQLLQLDTPHIDFMIRWHQQFMDKKYLLEDGTLNQALIAETGAPQAYDIFSTEQLVKDALSH